MVTCTNVTTGKTIKMNLESEVDVVEKLELKDGDVVQYNGNRAVVMYRWHAMRFTEIQRTPKPIQAE